MLQTVFVCVPHRAMDLMGDGCTGTGCLTRTHFGTGNSDSCSWIIQPMLLDSPDSRISSRTGRCGFTRQHCKVVLNCLEASDWTTELLSVASVFNTLVQNMCESTCDLLTAHYGSHLAQASRLVRPAVDHRSGYAISERDISGHLASEIRVGADVQIRTRHQYCAQAIVLSTSQDCKIF